MGKFKKGRRSALVRGNLIVETRKLRNLSRAALSAKANLSMPTLRAVEENVEKFVDQSTISKLSEALGLSWNQMLRDPPDEGSFHHPSDLDFESLDNACRIADDLVFPLIRSSEFSAEQLEPNYKALLEQHLINQGLSMTSLMSTLESRADSARLVRSMPSPALTIHVGDEFERLEFEFDDKRHQISDPKLLWDCNCIQAASAASKTPCRMHDGPGGLAAELSSRFSAGYVLIRFRQMSFFWKMGASLWPPSIDAFLMYKDLVSEGVLGRAHKRILDLGSGTGFLGIALACNNPNVTHLDLADWLLTPALYSVMNWRINEGSKNHVSVSPKIGLFSRWLEPAEKPYDLVIRNPPYLPLLDGYRQLGWESTVSGTDLLKHTIEQHKRLGKSVYIQFSQIALPEAMEAAKVASAKLVSIGACALVPFRVPLALKRPEYLEQLMEHRGLEAGADGTHPYWHRIQMYRIEGA